MNQHQAQIPAPHQREALWLIVVLVAALFAARLLAAGYGSFIETDSISLAAGIASIHRDGGGDIYRYGPQVGYYHLVSWLTGATGGDLLRIPIIMITLSVLAGSIIPLMGLVAFRDDLSRMERWLAAGTLAASPILWMSSRYGSSALMSVALGFGALVILSNRPALTGEIVALVLFAAAILVRADAVLVTPGVVVLLWRNHGRLGPAVLRTAVVGVFVAAIFALLFVFDPRMHPFMSEVRKHLVSPGETMFWEYLLWSVSPFVLIFAVLGLRELVGATRWLFACLVAWSFPVFAFYFASTTQPRYFLLTILPLAIATAVGMASVVNAAGKGRTVALVATVALCSVHLFVGLGRFVPRHLGFLKEASVKTHTGPLWTGALLYKSFWNVGLSNAPIFHPSFGAGTGAERTANTLFADLASGARRGRRILLLFNPFGNVLHFYAQVAGVHIVSKHDGPLWYRRFDMELGGAQLTTLGLLQVETDSLDLLPVREGDEMWFFERDGPTLTIVSGRLPAGLTLAEESPLPNAPLIWRYRVERRA